MSLELLGGRVLAPYFGGSIYVWGSIITVFMLALSAGYLLGGYLSLKRPNVHKLGLILLVAGILVCPLVLIAEPAMAWIFDRIEDPRYGSLLASMVLFMPPTIILGMISPYAVRLLVKATEESGRVAGTLYFCFHLRKRSRHTCNVVLFRALVRAEYHRGDARRRARPARVSRLRRWPGPMKFALLLALGLVCTAAAAEVIHEQSSLYGRILVTREGKQLCMQFSAKSERRRQSCIDEQARHKGWRCTTPA